MESRAYLASMKLVSLLCLKTNVQKLLRKHPQIAIEMVKIFIDSHSHFHCFQLILLFQNSLFKCLSMNCLKISYEFRVPHVSRSFHSHDRTNQSTHEDHFLEWNFFYSHCTEPINSRETKKQKKKTASMAHTWNAPINVRKKWEALTAQMLLYTPGLILRTVCAWNSIEQILGGGKMKMPML